MDNLVLYLFVLALMAQTAKLADFILRPHQKAIIQSLMEKACVRLESITPFNVLPFLNKPIGKTLLALPLLAYLLWYAWYEISEFYEKIVLNWSWTISHISDAFGALVWVMFILIAGPFFLWDYWSKRINRLIQKDFRHFLIGFSKLFGILLVWFLAFHFYWNFLVDYADNPGVELPKLPIFRLFIIFSPLFIAGAGIAAYGPPVASGILALVFWGISRLLYLCILFVHGITIRIVEYQKGAWQAIMLIITVILGVITAYIQFLS